VSSVYNYNHINLGLKPYTRIPYDRWHMQSYLLGVPKIFVGFHTWGLQINHTTTIRTCDIKTRNFDEHMARGYRALLAIRSYVLSEREIDPEDDKIWRITVVKGNLTEKRLLSALEAEQVKTRREDPLMASVTRIGIVPHSMIEMLRNRAGM
jgi:RAT1-interacting protein